jgi:AcrR family transcriptional regulator
MSETLSTPDALLGAARALFAERGFDTVTVREIAGRCHSNLPSLYHFFGSKELLYKACADAVFGAAAKELDAAWRAETTAARQIEAFVTTLGQLLQRDGELLAYVLQENRWRGGWLTQTPLAAPWRDFVAAAGEVRADEALAVALGRAVAQRALGRRVA